MAAVDNIPQRHNLISEFTFPRGSVKHDPFHRVLVIQMIDGDGHGLTASVCTGETARFSTLLAGIPTLLGQASYSREAEKEADAFSVDLLRAAKISPTVMVALFEKLSENREKDKNIATAKETGMQNEKKNSDNQGANSSWLGIAFSSHPANADRIAYFKQAAANQSLNLPVN